MTAQPVHYCRNPRCRSKLAEPVGNPHAAFCTRGCWEQYHHQRCVVCEGELERGAGNQRVCGRRKCRAELRGWPWVYMPFRAKTSHTSTDDKLISEVPVNRASKPYVRPLRGWTWIEVAEGWDLHNRQGDVAARVVEAGAGWRVSEPATIPAPPIEPLEAARRRGEIMALWALPPDPATAARVRTANRIVPLEPERIAA